MRLALQSQKFRPLKWALALGLALLTFHSGSGTESASSNHSKKPLTKTIPTDEQFKKNPIGMCGRACANFISCQKDEELNKKCQQFCPKSRCVTKGKKSAEGTTSTPDEPSQTQKSAVKDKL